MRLVPFHLPAAALWPMICYDDPDKLRLPYPFLLTSHQLSPSQDLGFAWTSRTFPLLAGKIPLEFWMNKEHTFPDKPQSNFSSAVRSGPFPIPPQPRPSPPQRPPHL